MDVSLMLLLGTASSLHCVTMCGPIVVVASAPARGLVDRGWITLVRWQAGYQIGRGLAYAAVGALLAFAGRMINALIPASLVGGLLQVVIGIAIVVSAGVALLHGRTLGVPRSPGPLTRRLARLVTSGRTRGMVLLGLVTSLLPCGVLYVAFARAAASGSPLAGGALMLAYWVGTVPALVVVAFASRGLLQLAGRKVAPILLTAAVVLTGGWLVYGGLHGLGVFGEAPCCPHGAAGQVHGAVLVAGMRPC